MNKVLYLMYCYLMINYIIIKMKSTFFFVFLFTMCIYKTIEQDDFIQEISPVSFEKKL